MRWIAGRDSPHPPAAADAFAAASAAREPLAAILDRAAAGEELDEGDDRAAVRSARRRLSPRSARPPMRLRRRVNGERVSYVVTRNINYTNICYFRCQFCAFSKGKLSENLRGRPYDLDLDEIERRASEAWERGAVEVCLQGGIHPEYTGATYLGDLPRDQGGGARHARPRLLAAGDLAGRRDARPYRSATSCAS